MEWMQHLRSNPSFKGYFPSIWNVLSFFRIAFSFFGKKKERIEKSPLKLHMHLSTLWLTKRKDDVFVSFFEGGEEVIFILCLSSYKQNAGSPQNSLVEIVTLRVRVLGGGPLGAD